MRRIEPVAVTEGGRLDRAGGIYLLTLEGDRLELGARHAELTRYISGDVPARYYRHLLDKVIHAALQGPTAGLRARLAAGLLYRHFGRRNRKLLSGGLLEELMALLSGLGCPPRMARRILLFPDILHYLAGKKAASGSGCSACFAAPERSASGGAVLGRNFDFFGMGVWDEYQAVKRVFPDDGQPHLWVGPLGIPGGGFGLNAAGLAVMPFSLFTRDCGTKGVPMFQLLDRMLREATCLEEAERLVWETRLTGSYSLLIADMNGGDARVFGIGKKFIESRLPEHGILCRTNHQQTEQGRKRERLPAGWARHSNARLARLEEFFAGGGKAASLEGVMALLGDRRDPVENREAVVGGILPAVNNALSLVLDAGRGMLAVGSGQFPVAACGNYELFSIKELFKKKDAWHGSHASPRRQKPAANEAIRCYNAAWQAWFERGDRERTLRLLNDGGALVPDEPAFPRMSGLLHMKGGDWEWAVRDLKRALALETVAGGRRAETGLWLARALDCSGRREEAVAGYDAVTALDPAGPWGRAAARGARRPWRRSQGHRIRVEFVTATGG